MSKFFLAMGFMFFCGSINADILSPYYTDTSKAIAYYSEIADKDSNNIGNYYDLASVFKEFGENDRAVDAYRQIVMRRPKEVRSHFELAKAYYFTGDYKNAEEEINAVIITGKENWEVSFWSGCILIEEGRFDEAIDTLAKGLNEDDRKNVVYIKLAQAYERKNDYLKAIENYKNALDADKTHIELNEKIALLYEKTQNIVSAFKYGNKLGDIDTKDKNISEKIKELKALYPEIKKIIEGWEDKKQKDRAEYMPPARLPIEKGEAIPKVKIGVLKDVVGVRFKCGADFKVYDPTQTMIFTGEKLKEYNIVVEGKKAYISLAGKETSKKYFDNEIYITKDEQAATTAVYGVKYGEGFYWAKKVDTSYRGDFIAKLENEKLTFINDLNVEEYLYGVIVAEMPASWPLEALKVQAVAARTYTFRNMKKHKKEGYDLCAQQHCAVYEGLTKEEKYAVQAVDETRGELLYSADNDIMDTFFHHSCGGHTEDAYDVWGFKHVKGLEGIYDSNDAKWNFPLSPFWMEEWVRTLPDVYCKVDGRGEVSFRWIRYLDGEGLAYFVNRMYPLGKIQKLEPVKRSKNGSITKVLIEGDKGSKIVNFDQIRNALGKLRSNVIKWEYTKDASGYIKEIFIYGAGWGHNVGMCQRGARGMAEKDKKYKEILYHYYKGSYIIKKYQ